MSLSSPFSKLSAGMPSVIPSISSINGPSLLTKLFPRPTHHKYPPGSLYNSSSIDPPPSAKRKRVASDESDFSDESTANKSEKKKKQKKNNNATTPIPSAPPHSLESATPLNLAAGTDQTLDIQADYVFDGSIVSNGKKKKLMKKEMKRINLSTTPNPSTPSTSLEPTNPLTLAAGTNQSIDIQEDDIVYMGFRKSYNAESNTSFSPSLRSLEKEMVNQIPSSDVENHNDPHQTELSLPAKIVQHQTNQLKVKKEKKKKAEAVEGIKERNPKVKRNNNKESKKIDKGKARPDTVEVDSEDTQTPSLEPTTPLLTDIHHYSTTSSPTTSSHATSSKGTSRPPPLDVRRPTWKTQSSPVTSPILPLSTLPSPTPSFQPLPSELPIFMVHQEEIDELIDDEVVVKEEKLDDYTPKICNNKANKDSKQDKVTPLKRKTKRIALESSVRIPVESPLDDVPLSVQDLPATCDNQPDLENVIYTEDITPTVSPTSLDLSPPFIHSLPRSSIIDLTADIRCEDSDLMDEHTTILPSEDESIEDEPMELESVSPVHLEPDSIEEASSFVIEPRQLRKVRRSLYRGSSAYPIDTLLDSGDNSGLDEESGSGFSSDLPSDDDQISEYEDFSPRRSKSASKQNRRNATLPVSSSKSLDIPTTQFENSKPKDEKKKTKKSKSKKSKENSITSNESKEEKTESKKSEGEKIKKKSKGKKREREEDDPAITTPSKKANAVALDKEIKQEGESNELDANEMIRRGEEPKKYASLVQGYLDRLETTPQSVLANYLIVLKPERFSGKMKKTLRKVRRLIEQAGGCVTDDAASLNSRSNAIIPVVINPSWDDTKREKEEAAKPGHLSVSYLTLLDFLLLFDTQQATPKAAHTIANLPTLSLSSAEAQLSGNNNVKERHQETTLIPNIAHPPRMIVPIPQEQFYNNSRHTYQPRRPRPELRNQPLQGREITIRTKGSKSSSPPTLLATANLPQKDTPAHRIAILFKRAFDKEIRLEWLNEAENGRMLRAENTGREAVENLNHTLRKEWMKTAFLELMDWTGDNDLLSGHALYRINRADIRCFKKKHAISKIFKGAGCQTSLPLAASGNHKCIGVIEGTHVPQNLREIPAQHEMDVKIELDLLKYLYDIYLKFEFFPKEIALLL